MDNAVKVAAALFVVVAIGGGVYVGRGYLNGLAAKKAASMSTDDKAKAVKELVFVARQQSAPELREWVKAKGPVATEEVLGALDDSVDTTSQVRLRVLDAIVAMGSDGLSSDAAREWAELLRRLATGMLHAGAERSDYFAKSYLMEGRATEASEEYAKVPESLAAKMYFRQNPDQRAPASK